MREPRWILDDEWAIGTDAYAWIIFKRIHDKRTGEAKGWRAKHWYPSANQLLESLARKITRTDQTQASLIDHIDHCYGRVEALSERFSGQLKAEVWAGLKRPSVAA